VRDQLQTLRAQKLLS